VSLYGLWVQAGGGTEDYDPERYRALMREHGYLLEPGDLGYEQGSRNLPCGWPHRPEPPAAAARRPEPLLINGATEAEDTREARWRDASE
jgi:hypothetical protein